MDLQVPIKELQVGPHSICLSLKQQQPVVIVQNQIYAHLWFLTDAIPELSDPQHLIPFAQISNFFWKGIHFQYVECIASYQKHYIERVELERRHPADVFEYRLTDYKIFDVSVMHEPKIEHDHLIYFVYQVATGLPYRVVCPYPYKSTSTLVHYQILPIKE